MGLYRGLLLGLLRGILGVETLAHMFRYAVEECCTDDNGTTC